MKVSFINQNNENTREQFRHVDDLLNQTKDISDAKTVQQEVIDQTYIDELKERLNDDELNAFLEQLQVSKTSKS